MKKRLQYLSFRAGLIVGLAGVLLLALLGGLLFLLLRAGGPLWPAALAAIVAAGLFAAAFWWGYKPYRELERVFMLFAGGYTLDGMYAVPTQMSPGTERAIRHIRTLLSRDELLNASKRQAQYLALQNQINPHFLYNTLEGIRGEALMNGSENIAMMTEALSTFFRYTISKVENLVTLEDELANVENYFLIQQYRFGKRVSLSVQFEDEEDRRQLLGCRLPKLTLQPIVENAIIHGLEDKAENGHIFLRVVGTGQRIIITVKDDGLGMDAATLERLRQRLNTPFAKSAQGEREQIGGIAIVNVNHRIHLLFGESYGLSVYSTPGLGTDVELTLPLRFDGDAPGEAV